MGDLSLLHVSASDIRGGAARAMYRLHRGLQTEGMDSRILAYYASSGDASVIGALSTQNKIQRQITRLSMRLNRLPLRFYPAPDRYWSLNWIPNDIADQINQLKPDLAHLHWVGDGFLPIAAYKKIKAPVVWTLHDMWAFTGGCHISNHCLQYREGCGACPQLQSASMGDISRRVVYHKRRHWRDLNWTIVAPSRWLADCARQSLILRDAPIRVIPNGLDITIYKPVEKGVAREALNLPQDKRLILFMVNPGDENKGFHMLRPALQKLAETDADSAQLVILGAELKEKSELPLRAHYPGYLRDEVSLALAYSAADVFVAPSIEENLPNSVMESLACATPSVAFRIGGMPDLIEHERNGYLAQPYEPDDLAQGMRWVLDETRHSELRREARKKVEAEFSLANVARQYMALYQQLVEGSVPPYFSE